MINETDLFWLAGIIDGEGYLGMTKRYGKQNAALHNGAGPKSFITRIQVANTDMGMIQRVSEIFCSLGAKFWYRMDAPDKRFKNAKIYIGISVEGYGSCKKVLLAIQGKLHTHQKQKQLELMLEYINYRLGVIAGKEVPVFAKDEKYFEKIRELKRFQVLPSTTKRVASTPLSW